MKRKKLFLTAIGLIFFVFLCKTSEAKAGAYDNYLTYGDFKYEYYEEENSIELVKYTGIAKEVWVPAAIGGVPVRHMYVTFNKNKRIEKVHLPNTIVTLGGFEDCVNLKEINIPKSVKKIKFLAFTDCNRLKKIELPEGLREIDCLAFAGCDSLKEVRIPNSVTKIESAAFSGCKKLEKVVLSKRLKCIEDETFLNCKKLKSIVIPEGVKEIWEDAFYNCTSLKKVKLPTSLIIIENRTFTGCAIKELTIPKNVLDIGAAAFADCKKLKKVVIKGTRLQELGNWPFDNIHPNAVFDVPNKYKAKYKKMLEDVRLHKDVPVKVK